MRCVGTLLILAALTLGQSIKSGGNWLGSQQGASGGWNNDPAVTGLCVLTYLGAGYTDRGSIKENRYVATVRRGLRYLLKHRGVKRRDRAIVALALCEAYWMTKNPAYRQAAQNSVNLVDGGDDPITHAWVVAALKSARFAKLDVPQERIDAERKWFDENKSPLAAELVARVFLRDMEKAKKLAAAVAQEAPDDPLTWFLGTIGTFQVGGIAWRRWNERMRRHVIDAQRPDGSWGGDVEATALYTMCLEVYYRYDRVFGTARGSDPTQPRGRSTLAPLTRRLKLDDGTEIPIDKLTAKVQVEGFRQRVRMAFEFRYDGDDLGEGKFQVRLPDGSSPHTLAFGAAAPKGFAMKAARMAERRRARRAYETIVSRRKDPALMEWDGSGVFSTRVFPLEPGKRHRIELGFDVDREFQIEGAEVVSAGPEADAMVGGGFTAVRVPPGVVSASIAGCTDVLIGDGRIAARGAGTHATLQMRDGSTRTLALAPVASSLTPRVYGELAVAQLEPFAYQGLGVPEAFARHFRVVRETCSLVMLESEEDYKRFGIVAKDDASVVKRVNVAAWLEGRRTATPKQTVRWWLQTAGKSTDLLDRVPDAEFENAPGTALACELAGKPRLGIVMDYDGHRHRNLCAQILETSRRGFWHDYALENLEVGEDGLVVLMRWDTDDSDVDLHVVDPDGDACNWRRNSRKLLSRDQFDGYGLEVYRLADPEPGEYVVRVNYFRPNGATRAHVVAIAHGAVTSATVELSNRYQMVEALRVTIPRQ